MKLNSRKTLKNQLKNNQNMVCIVQIVSSEGIESVKDGLHFSTARYRELGRRYGEKMLETLQINE